ncbi:MAG TPA: hypothetical protein VF245_00680 [Solirubrobacterales bacterium]
MRSIRNGALVGLVAFVVVGLLGATSASATTLCKAKEEVCSAGNRYPSGTVVKTSGKSSIVTSLGTITCTESSSKGESNEESSGSSTVALPILDFIFTFSGCKLAKTSCTVIPSLPWLLYWLRLGSFPFFHVYIEKDPFAAGGPSLDVVCGSLINCKYNLEGTLLEGEGGAPANLTANEKTVLTEEGEKSICPDTSKWVAKYEITEPNPLWVSPEP